MTKYVYVVGGSNYFPSAYYKPFAQFGNYTSSVRIVESSPKSIALAVFTGGEDVTPGLYGCERHRQTYCRRDRDDREMAIFKLLQEKKIPIVGVCRGSQFLCVMAGGKLIQHVNNHAGHWHNLRTDDDRLIWVSSTHHQMQYPPEGSIPVAWAEPRRSTIYEGDGIDTPDREHDCVFYPNINALGLQYHPEFMDESSSGFQYAGELVRRFFKLA